VCGNGYNAYTKLGVLDAITTWVVPLFILVGNMMYLKIGRIGYWNYLAIASNLLGDPIVAIMNLIAKLSIGRDQLDVAVSVCERAFGLRSTEDKMERDVAIILWALDDYEENNRQDDQSISQALGESLGNSFQANRVEIIKKTASKLTDIRANNARRIWLAIFGYLAAVSASFLKVKMSNDIEYHLPHTIALRELYYWLIPAIILSSMAGGWPSQWTSFTLLRELGDCLDCNRLSLLTPMQPWSGGDYLFRAHGRGLPGNIVDFILALTAVVLAFSWSFTMSWSTPTIGLGCRGLAEIGFLGTWLISAMVTLILRFCAKEGEEFWVWKWVWIKNGFLAVATFSMLLLPFLGK
jgi:hypothetical protein